MLRAPARAGFARALIQARRSGSGLARAWVGLRETRGVARVRFEQQQQSARFQPISQRNPDAVTTRNIGTAECALDLGLRRRIRTARSSEQLRGA